MAVYAFNPLDRTENDDDKAYSRVWWLYDRLEDLRPLFAR